MNKNVDRKFFSKVGFAYLVMAAAALVASLLIQIGLLNTAPAFLNDINIMTVISSICNYIIPLPFFLYLMKRLEKTSIAKHSLTSVQFIICICITLFLMYTGNIIGLGITSLIGHAAQTSVSNPVVELLSNSDIWINLLLVSVIGPVFEELLFRKVLIDRTIKYGGAVSVLLSALIFGLYHGNINQFFYAAFIGGFLAFVYVKTGNIKYSIGLHMIVNFMGSVVSTYMVGLMDKGGQTDMVIVMAYALILIIMSLVGLVYLLLEHKKFNFSGQERETALEKPAKTIILNAGMVCFIIFHIIAIIIAI